MDSEATTLKAFRNKKKRVKKISDYQNPIGDFQIPLSEYYAVVLNLHKVLNGSKLTQSSQPALTKTESCVLRWALQIVTRQTVTKLTIGCS